MKFLNSKKHYQHQENTSHHPIYDDSENDVDSIIGNQYDDNKTPDNKLENLHDYYLNDRAEKDILGTEFNNRQDMIIPKLSICPHPWAKFWLLGSVC